jgi:hypothetical protein
MLIKLLLYTFCSADNFTNISRAAFRLLRKFPYAKNLQTQSVGTQCWEINIWLRTTVLLRQQKKSDVVGLMRNNLEKASLIQFAES